METKLGVSEIINYFEDKINNERVTYPSVEKAYLRDAILHLKVLSERESIRAKLNVINDISVRDWDCDEDSLIYVIVEDTEINRILLRTIGATEDDFENMGGGEGGLDISVFAFDCGATSYKHGAGFLLD